MLRLGMWDPAPLEFSILTFENRLPNVQIGMIVQSCMSLEKERGKQWFCVCLCISMCVCACFCSCVWWMEIPDYVFAFSAMLPVCRLLCLHAEQPLHNNEKWHKRKYLSCLWLGLTGSVRSGAPWWQSPYFWEDGSVIRLIYFTPLPCNWTLGHRLNQSCQSLNWEGI